MKDQIIPYGRQDVTEEDIAAVVEVLRSDFLTQGPAVLRFENAVASHCGAAYAVAMNSATSALHLACLALGLGPGDWLWTSPITFVASSNCALYCGAQVEFVDIDPRTYNLSPDRLADKLALAEKNGTLPRVIVAVHLCGQPCDMAAIHRLAKQYGVSVIEDASHAIGGQYRGEPVGNCRFSDITVFSFHPVKIVTTAEGGMAVTNNPALAEKMALLRSHGITRDPAQMRSPSDGAWYYQQIALGFNYRMTDLQAALGASQMQRIMPYISKRQEIAGRYDDALRGLPLTTPWQHPDGSSARHLYVVRLNAKEIKPSHREVFDALRAANIGVNLHYIPIYRQPFYQTMGFAAADFPEAEQYYAEAISLPMYPTLPSEAQDHVVDTLKKVLAP